MKLSISLLCFFLAAPSVWAQYAADSQSGDFLFYMPRGWTRTESPQGTLIVAPLTTPRKAFIALMPATELSAGLTALFNSTWSGLLRNYRVVQAQQPSPWHSKRGIEGMDAAAVVKDNSGVAWEIALFVAKNGSKAESIFFMNNSFQDKDLNQTLTDVLHQVLDSIGFSGGTGDPNIELSAKPVPLPRTSGKFHGLYRAIGQIDMNPFKAGTPGNPYKYKVGYKYVVFFSDGRFKEGFPDQGLEKLDEDTEMRRDPVGWGTYAMEGEIGKVTFLKVDPHDRESIVWALREIAGGVEVHGDKYYPMDPCDGMKLQGTFRRSDYQTLSAGAQQGIKFFPDGRFVDEGVLKAAFVMVRNPVSGNYDFDDGAPGNGTYHVGNNTLELNYSNGRTKRTSFMIDPGRSKTDVSSFQLNTYTFARVQ